MQSTMRRAVMETRKGQQPLVPKRLKEKNVVKNEENVEDRKVHFTQYLGGV